MADRGHRRVAGWIGVALILVSLPLAGFGLIAFLAARRSAAAHSGIAGGLSGLTGAAAVAVMIVAAVAFVIGAICYVRAADK